MPGSITTKRLTSRRITAGDFGYIRETDSDPRIQEPIFGKVFTEEESRGRLDRWLGIERDHGLGFYLFSDANGNVVGHAGVFPSYTLPGNIEVGYALKPGFWNNGYATEMTVALLEAAFAAGYDRVISITGPKNIASIRVMQKAGLSFDEAFESERWGPCVRYAIDRDAWRRLTNT